MSLAEMFGNNTEDRFKNGPLLLTIEDAYRNLGLSRTRFFQELRDGRIRYIRVGSKRLHTGCSSPGIHRRAHCRQLTTLDSDRHVARDVDRQPMSGIGDAKADIGRSGMPGKVLDQPRLKGRKQRRVDRRQQSIFRRP